VDKNTKKFIHNSLEIFNDVTGADIPMPSDGKIEMHSAEFEVMRQRIAKIPQDALISYVVIADEFINLIQETGPTPIKLLSILLTSKMKFLLQKHAPLKEEL
jgi:hypothetical protein